MDFPNFFPTTITLQYFMFHRVLLRCAEVEVHPTQVDITMEVYAILKALYTSYFFNLFTKGQIYR